MFLITITAAVEPDNSEQSSRPPVFTSASTPRPMSSKMQVQSEGEARPIIQSDQVNLLKTSIALVIRPVVRNNFNIAQKPIAQYHFLFYFFCN